MNKNRFLSILCAVTRKASAVHRLRVFRAAACAGCAAMLLVTAFAVGTRYSNISVAYPGTHVRINGKEVHMTDVQGRPLELFTYEGTVYAPIRAIAEALGNEVGWDRMSNTVVVGDAETIRSEIPESTLKHFLQIAMQPVGSTMYIWGGGWNEEDTGSGDEAVSIGVSPQWKAFSDRQTGAYDYHNTRYQIHDGLDCSGYVGWALYNLFHTRNGEAGYVMKAQDMAKTFSGYGWGAYTPASGVRDFKPGDIMSSSGHVYIVVGACGDGSIVVAHSSPPGVQLCGTAAPNGQENSQAASLAREYMGRYFPEWHRRFPNCTRGASYLNTYNQMRWTLGPDNAVDDPDGVAGMSAEQVLKMLFEG